MLIDAYSLPAQGAFARDNPLYWGIPLGQVVHLFTLLNSYRENPCRRNHPHNRGAKPL